MNSKGVLQKEVNGYTFLKKNYIHHRISVFFLVAEQCGDRDLYLFLSFFLCTHNHLPCIASVKQSE